MLQKELENRYWATPKHSDDGQTAENDPFLEVVFVKLFSSDLKFYRWSL